MAIKISNVTVIDDNRKETNMRLTTLAITANTSASAGTYYYLDGPSIALTLPATPSEGDQVGIAEIAGQANSVINRNGSNIMKLAENLIVDRPYASFRLTYVDATVGWAFT